jgi:hypothetical protein
MARGGTFGRLDVLGEMAVQRTPDLGEGIPMAGRHSKRPGVHVGITWQGGMRPLRVIDARTHVEHPGVGAISRSASPCGLLRRGMGGHGAGDKFDRAGAGPLRGVCVVSLPAGPPRTRSPDGVWTAHQNRNCPERRRGASVVWSVHNPSTQCLRGVDDPVLR